MAKEEPLLPQFTPRLSREERVEEAKMQGFAPYLFFFSSIFSKKQTTCVKVRAGGIIPVHSNKVLQWTVLKLKFKYFVSLGFFYLESVGEPT